MSSKGSFYNSNTAVYTETNPPGPIDTPPPVNLTSTPSSFFGGGAAESVPLDAVAAAAQIAADQEVAIRAVRYDTAQVLSPAQQLQARSNIALAPVASTGNYADLTGVPILGSASTFNVGTSANNVVQLNGSAGLPAVDGSLLTNLTLFTGLYASRTVAAAATVPSAFTWLRVAGYALAGDGGAALYKKVTTLASAASGFTSADGAKWQLSEFVLRPEMFSATADTSAIQTAIDVANAVATVGEVRLAARNYRAVQQGVNAYCLNLYGCVQLIGEGGGAKDGTTAGLGSVISWGSSITSTTDILSWNSGGAALSDARISRVQFMPDGFTATNWLFAGPFYGRHVIECSTTSNLSDHPDIADCLIGPSLGNSIHIDSGVGGNFASGVIERNWIWGGIYINATLDNTVIVYNRFSGIPLAMDITCTAGAGNLTIAYNNGNSTGGALWLRSGFKVNVIGNYFEMGTTSTASNGYLYNINGTAGTLQYCKFKDNICGLLGNYGMTGLVYVHNTIALEMDGNVLTNSGTGTIYGFHLTSSNTNPVCGATYGNSGLVASSDPFRPGYYLDSVAATGSPVGVSIPLTFVNSWIAGVEAPTVRLTKDGIVHVNGYVSSGTTTAGTGITTLPVGYRPTSIIYRSAVTSTGGSCLLKIDTSGNVTIYNSTADAVFTGLNFTLRVAI